MVKYTLEEKDPIFLENDAVCGFARASERYKRASKASLKVRDVDLAQSHTLGPTPLP